MCQGYSEQKFVLNDSKKKVCAEQPNTMFVDDVGKTTDILPRLHVFESSIR